MESRWLDENTLEIPGGQHYLPCDYTVEDVYKRQAKQYEAKVLGRNRAAYQGVEGAFAHIAIRALFPHAEAVSCPTWDEMCIRDSIITALAQIHGELCPDEIAHFVYTPNSRTVRQT